MTDWQPRDLSPAERRAAIRRGIAFLIVTVLLGIAFLVAAVVLAVRWFG